MDIFLKLLKLKKLMGREIKLLTFYSLVIGFVVFAAEYSFVFAMQSFLVEIGITTRENVLLPSFYPTGLLPSLVAFLGVGFVRTAAYMLKSFLSGVAHQAFLRDQRTKFFDYSILNAQLISSHDVMSAFTDTLSRGAGSILNFISLIITLSSSAMLFVSGFYLAPKELIIGTVLGATILLPIKILNKKTQVAGQGLTDDWHKVTKLMLEGIRHNYFFKAHGLEEELIDHGSISIKSYENHYIKFFIYSSLRHGIPNFVGIVLICTLAYLSLSVFHTPGSTLLAFLYLFVRLSQGIAEVISTQGHLRLSLNSVEDLIAWNERFLYAPNRKTSALPDKTISLDRVELKMEDVSFGYSSERIISSLSLEIKTGDILVIKGESGVGKSTLLSLLLGLNKPTAGELLLNGARYETEAQKGFSNSLAYVGPEPFLFEGTIRENLLYGNPKASDITDGDIYKLLDMTNLLSYVKSLPHGLNFKYEEHAEASTGQKQRLSLCRALLRQPKLLILDEATANLDKETEANILNALKPALKGMTTVIVTHKEALASYGNHLLLLQKGGQHQLKNINV